MNRFVRPYPTPERGRPVTIPLLLAAFVIELGLVLWLLHDATGYSILPTNWSPTVHVEKEIFA